VRRLSHLAEVSVPPTNPPASRWIRFLRNYGPVSTNENMYDEAIFRALGRTSLQAIDLPAPHLDRILENLSSDPDPRSVVLTGTAGDGKTYHCRQVWLKLGGTKESWDVPGHTHRIPHRSGEVVLVKDLTELSHAEATEIVEGLAAEVFGPYQGRAYLVAGNHGQLLSRCREVGTPPAMRLEHLIEDLMVSGERDREKARLCLYDLSREAGADVLDAVLGAILDHPGWDACVRCPYFGATPRCPIYENRSRLLESTPEGRLLRSRLRTLLRLGAANGVHFPMRQVFALATNMLLGHPGVREQLLTCEDVGRVLKEGDGERAAVYANVFGENLPERTRDRRERIFGKLARFGIGDETSNRIDTLLAYGSDDPDLAARHQALLGSDPTYGATAAWRSAQHNYLEVGSQIDDDTTQQFLSALRRQRQRLFFVLPDDLSDQLGLWELTVYRFAGDYLSLVDALSSKEGPRPDTMRRLVRGLNRIFTGLLVGNTREILLATSGTHSQAKMSRLLDAAISVHPNRGEKVLPVQTARGLNLRVDLGSGLPPLDLHLTLIRFEFLCRVAEGSLPSSFSLECYEDLLAFKSQMLRFVEDRRRVSGDAKSSHFVVEFLELSSEGQAQPRRVEVMTR
jgi:hypothetical protein